MTQIIRLGIALTTMLVGVALGTPPATAASPNGHASCAAQLDQGGTPHGLSESSPGFLGQFTSEEARSAPGVVGTGTSGAARLHGTLFDCLPGEG